MVVRGSGVKVSSCVQSDLFGCSALAPPVLASVAVAQDRTSVGRGRAGAPARAGGEAVVSTPELKTYGAAWWPVVDEHAAEAQGLATELCVPGHLPA